MARARRLKVPAPSCALVGSAEVEIDEAVDVAASVIGAASAVFDGQLRLIAHSAANSSDADWCGAVVSRSARRADSGLISAADLRRLLATTGPISLRVPGGHIATGLRASGYVVGVLVVHGPDAPSASAGTDDLTEALTQALVRRLHSSVAQQRSNALALLLRGEGDGASLGVDEQVSWRVLAAMTRDGAPTEEAVRRALATTLSDLSPPVTQVGTTVYALVPDHLDLAARIQRLHRRLPSATRIALGLRFTGRAAAVRSRSSADDVAAYIDAPVVWADEHPATLLLAAISKALHGRDDLRLPALDLLADHDARTNSRYLDTLAAWLQLNGDVAAVAKALHLHPNTVRYRVRRACMVSGLDLDDSTTRLAATVALCCGLVQSADEKL